MITRKHIRTVYWFCFAITMASFIICSTETFIVYPAIVKARAKPIEAAPKEIVKYMPAPPPVTLVKVETRTKIKTVDLKEQESCQIKAEFGLKLAKNLCDRKDSSVSDLIVQLSADPGLTWNDINSAHLENDCLPQDFKAPTPSPTALAPAQHRPIRYEACSKPLSDFSMTTDGPLKTCPCKTVHRHTVDMEVSIK